VFYIEMQSFNQTWFSPTFSTLLENRRESLILAGAGIVHLGLNLAGLSGWVCPIRAATGIPCPGCGLTLATIELLRGDFQASFQTHAFAPIFLLAVLVMGINIILPESQRKAMLKNITWFETRSGITAWVLFSLMLYWAFRLIA
jgi:hypothetical protein